MASVIDFVFSPPTPAWVRWLALSAIAALVIWWLVKPPHWADAEGPDKRSGKRVARPPD